MQRLWGGEVRGLTTLAATSDDSRMSLGDAEGVGCGANDAPANACANSTDGDACGVRERPVMRATFRIIRRGMDDSVLAVPSTAT